MRRLIISSAVALAVMIGSVSYGWDPVYFADPWLKTLVEERLGMTNPTADDMMQLWGLNGSYTYVRNLTGLEYAKNMEVVLFDGDYLIDISPLAGLAWLTYLSLDSNRISDILPLATNFRMEHLFLGNNLIDDISPLSWLMNLQRLGLNSNRITNISVLCGLTKLQVLCLQDNRISDISPLSGLTNLLYLGLGNNQISKITPLSGLTELQALLLDGNQISDITPLSGLTNLVSLWLNDNKISDISPLSGLRNLLELDLRKNPLNKEAYDIYIPLIRQNNPGITLLYDPPSVVYVPTVSTLSATYVEQTSARLRGRIEDDGGEACQYTFTYWDDGVPHTTSWSSETFQTGDEFYLDVTPLKPGCVYYFKAYAKNSAGESYGSSESFKTTTEQKWFFVHITDPHIGYRNNETKDMDETTTYLDATVNQINHMSPRPDLVLVTGDIVDAACECSEWDCVFTGDPKLPCVPVCRKTGPCLSYYNRFGEAIRKLNNINWYVVPGNHDRVAQGTLYGTKCDNDLGCYSDVGFETEPNFVVHQNILFIGLDSGYGNEKGEGLTDPQFSRLKRLGDQYPDMDKILFMHHPGVDGRGSDWSIERKRGKADGTDFNFLDWCDENKVQLVLAGHTHQSHISDRDGKEPTEQTKTRYVQTPSCAKKELLDDDRALRLVEFSSPANPMPCEEIRAEYTQAALFSPGNVHIYDSGGRHVGAGDGGEVEYGIPDAFYHAHYTIETEDGEQVFPEKVIIFDPCDKYLYEVVGKEEGTYDLLITRVKDGNEIIVEANDIPILPGAVHDYIVDWEALVEGEDEVKVYVDEDGDGDTDLTITAGKNLTGADLVEVTTKDATDIGQNSAVLWARINDDGGEACNYRFRYKMEGGPYTYTPWNGSVTTGESFSQDISGLTPATTYYYSAQRRNSAGEGDWSSEMTLTTLSPPQRTLVVSSTDGGMVTDPGEGGFQYDHGSSVPVVATPAANYHFVNWTGTAVDAGKVADPDLASTTVTVDADYTLHANFAMDQRTLTISASAGGSVTTPGQGPFQYDHDTSVPVVATPLANYHFVNWTGTAVDAGKVADPSLASTTVIVDADYTLQANFAIDQRTLTISSTAGGSVTTPGQGPFQYDHDTSVPVVATAGANYHFANWTGTAVDVGKVADPNAGETTVIMDADYTLQANFAIDQHTLTISSTAGGSVTTPGQGAFPYDHGSSVPVVATPEANCHFVNWTGTAVDAGKVSDPSLASTTVTMDADYTIQANFAIDQHTLTISSTASGSVTTPGQGPFQYDYGSSVPVVATPAANYHFVNWTGTAVDAGKVADPSAASTTVTVDADYTLQANFAIDQRTLAVSSTAGGSVSTPGEGPFTYEHGSLLAVVAAANTNCRFVKWTGTAVEAGKVADPSVAATEVTVNADYTLRAVFATTLDILYVDDDAPADPCWYNPVISDPNENGSPAHPFDLIAEAIEVSVDGVTIVVRPGTYYESIDFAGKAIKITGFEPNLPKVVYDTVIDANGLGTVVTFDEEEDANSILSGLVITGGKGSQAGGIYCYRSSPTISNCLIVGNRVTTDAGAAIYCQDSNAVISNCTIADNFCGADGAGLYSVDSNVVVDSSILWGNWPKEISTTAGNLPTITYSMIQDHQANPASDDPLFAARGRWVDVNAPEIVVEPNDPNATWLAGDYHLQSQAGRWDPNSQTWVKDDVTSPGIDAGDPTNADWTAELWPHGERINMGAFGGTAEASMSLSTVGNVADLTHDGVVDLRDLAILCDSWLVQRVLLAEDLDRNSRIDESDLAILGLNWRNAPE